MPTDSILKSLDFGNEAGDDASAAELLQYFVEHDTFGKFADPTCRLMVATARKGVGKSALMKWTGYKAKERDPEALVINVRGADLVRSRFGLTTPLTVANDYARDWMVRLCALVNRELARQLKIALSDDHISMIEMAELEGYRERNLVGCLVERLQTVLLQRGKIEKSPIKNEIELLKRFGERNVWIVVDDLDATFQNTPAECLALATFFSACRYLVQDITGINIRASVRTDVWAILRRYDEALDKVTQYVAEIHWRQRDFLALLALRIRASLSSKSSTQSSSASDQERLVELAFIPQMQWGDSTRASDPTLGLSEARMVDSYKIIYTLSYERPRWAIQLCKLAQEAAVRHDYNRISKQCLDEVWGEYGAKRIEDLVAEHKHQCPQVHELLHAFRGAERLMSRQDLFMWINNRVSTHLEVTIEGERTRKPQDISRFLYRIGFIVARSDGEQGKYEHYRFDQMPDFLSVRTDDDFAVKWEIHPCYRQALDIKKLDQSHRERFRKQRTID